MALFLYDFNSPYAYLAASRVDAILPVAPVWRPVAFAFMLRAQRREPWSFDARRRPIGMAECEQRARTYGLPPIAWPPGWPVDSYGLTALRAAIVAEDHGRLREFSHAAFARNFVTGQGLTTEADVLAVADQAGLDAELVGRELASPEVKQRLARYTDEAIAHGVAGVPAIVVGDGHFWGDDQLEAAATVLRDRPAGAG